VASSFVDMSAQECRDRLGAGGVGRVAFCAPDGPQIYPVTFSVVDEDVVFRVAPYTRLGMHVPGQDVAFEVDEVDHARRDGWSVVVKGRATPVDDPDEILRLRRQGPQPWAPGQRHLYLRIRPRSVTGRSVTGD
jgi:uncharacterized protein